MTNLKKLQLIKSILAIVVVSILIVSCKKETAKTTASSNEKLTAGNNVGLPPTIIGWGREPDVPIVDAQGNPESSGVGSAFSFAINGKGYIGGGLSNPDEIHSVYQFDTTTRSWIQLADFPGSNNMIAATFVIGNYAYVCTGGANASKENWQYSQLTNTWTRKADFPGSSRIAAVGASINGKGYVGLGFNCDHPFCNDTKDWWEYDPTSDSWTRKADFPGTRREYAVAFTINDKGYVGTGWHYNQNTNANEFYKDLWQYNPANDSWTQKADMPVLLGRWRAFGANAFVNKGVIATGSSGMKSGSDLNDCWEYIPSSNSWVQLPNVGGGARSGAAGFGIGNTLYIGTAGNYPDPNDFWGLTINP